MPNLDDGVGGQVTEGNQTELAADAVPVTPQQAPDTVDAPLTESPDSGTPSPQDVTPDDTGEVTRLNALLDEQKRIQAGLDRANTNLQQQLQQSQDRMGNLEDRLAQYGTADGANSDIITELQQQLEQEQQARQEWQTQAESAIQDAERSRILVGEFPELAPLLDADALPVAPDADQFREKLTQISQGLASVAESQYQQRMSGARPPSSPPAQTVDADLNSLGRQMAAAVATGDDATYAQLKKQWYAANKETLALAPSPHD